MTLFRPIRTMYLAFSIAWAACLVVIGLWLAIETPRVLLISSFAVAVVGVVCVSAGNFVFMVRVADRIFPSVARRQVSWVIELFMLSMIGTLLVLLGALL